MTSPYAKRGLIEAGELAALIESGANVQLVDATYSPGAGEANFRRCRIHNAVFFDIDQIADPSSDMPHMLPAPEDFAKAVGALGTGNDDLVVVYDQAGIAMAAARAWWMFRVFGHDNVCVLNGGLPYWHATGHGLVETPPQKPQPASFEAAYRPALAKDLAAMQQALSAGYTVLDARGAERFSGRAQEPRPGMRSGHIPGSLNLPFMTLIDPADGRLRETDELRNALGGLTAHSNVVCTCGSGVTACVLALALYTLGKQNVAVYDGSWTEWGRTDKDTAVAVLS